MQVNMKIEGVEVFNHDIFNSQILHFNKKKSCYLWATVYDRHLVFVNNTQLTCNKIYSFN
jgi:hypothetical protein